MVQLYKLGAERYSPVDKDRYVTFAEEVILKWLLTSDADRY